ncbi:MAG TPA: adenylate/guanylate cyclase domain-containing protein [Allocoleopsis sp.]
MLTKIKQKISEHEGLIVVAIATILVSGIMTGLKNIGMFQSTELLNYDQMSRLEKERGTDERLLIVGINDQDIKNLKNWPITDEIFAKLLGKLQKYQPRVIGIDIYRDLPVEPGHQQLLNELKKPNVISIRNIDTLEGASGPDGVSPAQIGFNDVSVDPDGIIRRNLFFADSKDGTIGSFSLLMVLTYLDGESIFSEPSKINPNYMQLGQATLIPLKPDSGGYQNIDNAGQQILFKYRSHENLAAQVSLHQVLSDQVKPELIKDKIVIIGTTALSLKDAFYTPYSAAAKQQFKMPGVLIHGHLTSHLLDSVKGKVQLFTFWTESQEILWLVLWTMLGAICAWYLRHPLLIMGSLGTILIILFGSSFYGFTQSVWIPVISPSLSVILAFGSVITYSSYQSNNKQKIIFKLLGQNTSPSVAQALWKSRDFLIKDGKLPGQKAMATLLFSDLKNFSTVSEQKTPEELMEWLNQMLENFTEEVLKREGIINKFTGDGIMAAFGVPVSDEQQESISKNAQNAVYAALAMGESLEKLNQLWQEQTEDKTSFVQMRIGIFTGPVVVGSLGGKDRLEYGIIGDTVNTASRLESLDKERQPSNCRILIGADTLQYLDDKFLVESWGVLPLKGKQQPVHIYLVVGKKEC